MKRNTTFLTLFILFTTGSLADRAVAGGSKAPPGAHSAPAPVPTTRRPSASELKEIVHTALVTSGAKLPKGASITTVRSSAALDIPIARDRVTIDMATAPRRAGTVTATAVLTFWKAADVAARLPVTIELSIAAEGLIFDASKGAPVTLVVRRGLVEVTAPAVLAADADIGDVVQVLLRPSGRALRAQLIAKDRAVAAEDAPMTSRTFLIALTASLLTSACGPKHIEPFTPRHRVYKEGDYAQKSESARPASGSLFSEAKGGFLEDTRAGRVGDLLVIRIEETANASGGATTNMKRENNSTSGTSAVLGLMPALKKAYPTLDPSKLLEFATKNDFGGEGDTARKGQLTGTVAVRIVREMPNGDLFLEGTKVVLINNEEYHLYISGLVRPTDISKDNSVDSLRVADAQVEFTGRGDLADQQRKGWFSRALDTINPF